MSDQNEIKIAKLETEVEFLKAWMADAKNEITELKGSVNLYQTSTVQVKQKLDQIFAALAGDNTGNVGMVKRLANVELVVEWVNAKKSYVWGMVAGIGAVMGVVIWGIEKVLSLFK
ncbi:hypothetical protein [Rufibacter latericius]|uniref:DUF1515 domain-containing protein n=1 Tax=Rufibacter latericius TaxID=2487040 RepID=A0A3M9MMC4_9BACT|nr:hypothetical protein [Rufibacter latericius]RNI26641.1 hypothetical protein EFB08_11525 [Rufibacter latericius]